MSASGIVSILEGHVGWFEVWDARYGVTLNGSGRVTAWLGRRHSLMLTPISEATAPDYDVVPGRFNELPTVHTYHDGTNERSLRGLGILSMPATARPHLAEYIAAETATPVTVSGAFLRGTSSLLGSRETSLNRVSAFHRAGTLVSLTGAADSYTVGRPHFRENFSTSTHYVLAMNGVDVVSVSGTLDYAEAFTSLDLRNSTDLTADRRFAVLIATDSLIPSPQRAAVQAYCEMVYQHASTTPSIGAAKAAVAQQGSAASTTPAVGAIALVATQQGVGASTTPLAGASAAVVQMTGVAPSTTPSIGAATAVATQMAGAASTGVLLGSMTVAASQEAAGASAAPGIGELHALAHVVAAGASAAPAVGTLVMSAGQAAMGSALAPTVGALAVSCEQTAIAASTTPAIGALHAQGLEFGMGIAASTTPTPGSLAAMAVQRGIAASTTPTVGALDAWPSIIFAMGHAADAAPAVGDLHLTASQRAIAASTTPKVGALYDVTASFFDSVDPIIIQIDDVPLYLEA